MKLEQSYGIIKYEGDKCSLEVSKDFGDYYFSLIPKYYYANRPRYKPHITIVRSGIETIKENYGMWDGMKVPFVYEPTIKLDRKNYFGEVDNTYFLLDCFSLYIGLLREHLGLTWFRKGFNSYHLTIANLK